MPDRRLCNARIHGWLAEDLDRVADQTASSKVQVNSAAVWWFCHKLPPEERARILGEFVTAQAMRGGTESALPEPSSDGRSGDTSTGPRRQRRPSSG